MTVKAVAEVLGVDKTKAAFASVNKGLARIQKAAKIGSTAVGALGVGFLAAANKASKYADEIVKTARTTGLSTTNLQAYRRIADLSGVSTELFTSSLVAFNKRLGEAASNQGPLVSGLKKLNPELLQSLKNAKNTDEAFLLFSDAVQKAGTSTEKAALNNAAFSRSGIVLGRITEQGSASIKKQIKTVDELGQILDVSSGDSEKLRDAISNLSATLKVQFFQLILNNSAFIVGFFEDLSRALPKVIEGVKEFFGVSAGAFARRLREIDAEISEINEQLTTGRGILNLPKILGGGGKSADELKERLSQLKAESKELRDLIIDQATVQDRLNKRMGEGQTAVKALGKDIVDTTAAVEDAAFLSEVEARIDRIIAKVPQLDLSGVSGFRASQEVGIDESPATIKAAEAERVYLEELKKREETQERIAAKTADNAERELEANQRTLEKIQEYNEELAALADAYEEPIRAAGSFREAQEAGVGELTKAQVKSLGAEYRFLADDINLAAEIGTVAWQTFTDAASTAVARFVQTGTLKFKDLVDSILVQMARLSANAIFSGLLGLTPLGGSVGFIGGIKKAFGFSEGGVMSPQGQLPLKRYQGGGIANRPQLAVFGEGSGNEAFVPLPDGRAIPVRMESTPQSPMVVEVNLDGEKLFKAFGRASRDGRLVLSARGVV